MHLTKQLFIFFKLPSQDLDIMVVNGDEPGIADYAYRCSSLQKLFNSFVVQYGIVAQPCGSYYILALPLNKLGKLNEIISQITSTSGWRTAFGVGPTTKAAAKACLIASQKNLPYYMATDDQLVDGLNKSDSDLSALMVADENQTDDADPVDYDKASELKETLFGIDPYQFKLALNDLSQILSNFKHQSAAFDMVANQNPDAYQSMLSVVQATSALATMMIESGLIEPEDQASIMASEDIQAGLAEQNAGESDGEENNPYKKKGKGVPVGTVRYVTINNRRLARIKGQDGKWHFMNRGQIASANGTPQGQTPTQLQPDNATSDGQNVAKE